MQCLILTCEELQEEIQPNHIRWFCNPTDSLQLLSIIMDRNHNEIVDLNIRMQDLVKDFISLSQVQGTLRKEDVTM